MITITYLYYGQQKTIQTHYMSLVPDEDNCHRYLDNNCWHQKIHKDHIINVTKEV